jgi:hypothetical protein
MQRSTHLMLEKRDIHVIYDIKGTLVPLAAHDIHE